MAEPAPSPDFALADLRASASSDDGLVTAVADGTGRLVELSFEPTAMRKSSEDLAAVTRTTVLTAQDAARDQARARLGGIAPALPALEELTGTLQQLQATATGKLAEMSTVLQQLFDRTPGGPR